MSQHGQDPSVGQTGPVEAPFERDYPAPDFTPGWKHPQINRLMVQDFVIGAHMDTDLVKQLLVREPGLVNACMDWGGGDWETALGAASHMGRADIVGLLLAHGARTHGVLPDGRVFQLRERVPEAPAYTVVRDMIPEAKANEVSAV